MVGALVGTILAALPYLGVGPDTSPDADTYLERRYGNIGIGLTVMWLALMAALFLVGLVVAIVAARRRRRSAARS
ncbi:MAG: hypothetical protein Q7T27_06585 [Pseudomonas sp.]|uniref:hypothetical protein n=1 Tax=Pseudomonas sp. TaxID=306 RepID=UPI0027251A8C|nr:hypothetical protein [Pseudomonas sp.]MDO8403146.1 hypothetical protein [Pseudomonas sp.]